MAMAAMVEGGGRGGWTEGVEKSARSRVDGREDCSSGVIRSGGVGGGERPAPSTVTPDVPNGYFALVLSSLQHHLGLAAARVSYVRPPSSWGELA